MRKTVCAGVLIAVGILACGDEMTDSAGDALRKAGKAIADAGEALADAGSDASAQEDAGQAATGPVSETYELACDQISERVTVEYYKEQLASTTTRTERYAVLSTDTARIIGADVRRCGREQYGKTVFRPCRPSTTTAITTYVTTCQNADLAVPADCEVGVPAWIDSGTVRVSCGSRTHAVYPEPYTESSSDEGELFKTVTLTIRRS